MPTPADGSGPRIRARALLALRIATPLATILLLVLESGTFPVRRVPAILFFVGLALEEFFQSLQS